MHFADVFDVTKVDGLIARQGWGGAGARLAVCKQSYGFRMQFWMKEVSCWVDAASVRLSATDLLCNDWVPVPRRS